MARQQRQPFSPTGDYVTIRDFRFAGRHYSRGSLFPWRKLSCSTRKLLQLWEGRFINLVDGDLPEEVSEDATEEEVVNEVETEGDKSEETTDDTEEEAADEAEETEEETEEQVEEAEEADDTDAEDEDEADNAEDEDEAETEVTDKFVFNPDTHKVSKSKKHGLCIKKGKKFIMNIDEELAEELREATEPVEIELG